MTKRFTRTHLSIDSILLQEARAKRANLTSLIESKIMETFGIQRRKIVDITHENKFRDKPDENNRPRTSMVYTFKDGHVERVQLD